VPVYQSRDFAAAAAKAGDDVQLKVVAGEGHFEHLDPRTEVWRELRTWLDALA
jgi:pimeloyl-ACP methyl ester carboxylesterase